LATVDVDGWMFVGAMENHREILRRLLSEPRLGRYFGPSLAAVERLRDPMWLAERLAPLTCYPAASATKPDASNGRWLRKPLSGGGGRGIRREEESGSQAALDEPVYWQQEIRGDPCSALFLAAEQGPRLLTVSRQLIGWDVVAAPTPFTYCGSISPWPAAGDVAPWLMRLVERLLDGLELRGLIGIDFVWDGDRPWVVEVNPRYTASTELWEYATGRCAVAEHLRAFESGDTGERPEGGTSAGDEFFGKAILFADRPVIGADLSRYLTARSGGGVPLAADIPASGRRIERGWPICTVFASGVTAEACAVKLARRARSIRQRFRDA
jgi:predicted ATP-grasp superfamily ATP-dependent carboligase